VAETTAVGVSEGIGAVSGGAAGPNGIEPTLQAMEVIISKTGKISLCLMNQSLLLFENNTFDLGEV